MIKYFKAIYEIILNYRYYSLALLAYEFYFQISYNKKFNKFKYLKSNFLSDAIPCSYFFLKKIEKFIEKKNINNFCDLGAGYGKILYFFGKIREYKIDGIELDKEIYREILDLKDKNINIYNQDILKFNLIKKNYMLFIINDPLKKTTDFKKLAKKILKLKKKYTVFINLNLEKTKFIEDNFKVIQYLKISPTRNIFFCINKK